MRVGEVVGNYRITGKLGAGGMGAVYLARHTLIGREAAIKVLLPELCSNDRIIARFFNEARSATAIKHPGIVEIYDFGYAGDGSAYIVMERLEGETLGTRLKRQRALPVEQALSIARQVTGALAAAHRLGIVHRDLKPDNIFIVRDPDVPGGERAKILDFGIAKLRHKEGDFDDFQTEAGTVMGAPTYMAPEMFEGAEKVDASADQYSLGCILFEMICGRPPFDGRTYGSVMAQQLRAAPPAPSSIERTVGSDLEQVILRLLAKKPDQRFASAVEALERLHRVSGMTAPPVLRPIIGSPSPMPMDEMGSPFESVNGATPMDRPRLDVTSSGVVSSARRTLALAAARGESPPESEEIAPTIPHGTPPHARPSAPWPLEARPGTAPGPAPAVGAPPAMPSGAAPAPGGPPWLSARGSVPMPQMQAPPHPSSGSPPGLVPAIGADEPTVFDEAPVFDPRAPGEAGGRPMDSMAATLAPTPRRRTARIGVALVGTAIAIGGAAAFFIATSDNLGDETPPSEVDPAAVAGSSPLAPAAPPPSPLAPGPTASAPGPAASAPGPAASAPGPAAFAPAPTAVAPALTTGAPPAGATAAAMSPPPASAAPRAPGPPNAPPAAAAPAAADAPAPEPPRATNPAQETNREPSALITMRVDSRPRGALVIRKQDGVRVGETPMTYETEPQKEPVSFVLRHPGYRDELVTVPGNRSSDRTIPLIRSAGLDRAPDLQH